MTDVARVHLLRKQNYGLITFKSKRTHGSRYAIGFRNAHVAKNVMYNMKNPDKFGNLQDAILLPDLEPLTMRVNDSMDLLVHARATLFLPKNQEPEKDDFLGTIETNDYHEFLLYPLQGMGIVIPYFLVAEDDQEYVYTAHAIDPVTLHD